MKPHRCRGAWTFACALAGATAWGARFTSQSYVQDGLVTQFDAIENVGVGLAHDAGAAVWKDLKGSASITLPAGTQWTDRALDAANVAFTVKGMPAFYLDSVATEIVMDSLSHGTSGYPRAILHPGGDGWYSVYFSPGRDYPQFFIEGRSTPRPSFGDFAWGTLGMASDTTNYRVYQNGVAAGNSGTTAVGHSLAEAKDWTCNVQYDYLQARYRALRHYNRALAADEFTRNAHIDLFRFYSFALEGTASAAAVPWSSAGWVAPRGRTETLPNADTNDYARIVGARVSVSAADSVVLRGLSLEEGAVLALPAGAEVCVKLLYAECALLGRGVYTGAEGTAGTKVGWISGAGQVRVSGDGFTGFPHAHAGFGPLSYVQDGLVTHFDAIDNAGTGVHDASATVWRDLAGNASLALVADTAWAGGRYFLKTNATYVAFGTVPAYVRDSITCEVPVNIYTNASSASGNYPRIFSNGESFSIYFTRADQTAYVYINGQTGDPRPNLGLFRIGTIAAFSGSQNFGGAVDGAVKARTSAPATNGLKIAAANWMLGNGGLLTGAYGGLRFYKRCLTADELAWNARVDKFRYFAYRYANDGTALDWADIAWDVPEGQTAAAPAATTNQYVTLSAAEAHVAATDAVALAGLALEDGATLRLDAGATVATKLLYVNGQPVGHGIYTAAGGATGIAADWIAGAGRVCVAGGTDSAIPSVVPTPDADGWYTFGLMNGKSDVAYIVGEHPVWSRYWFPAGAKLRLQGYLLLETVPDVFADYDTSRLQCAYVNGVRAYAADRTFEVPSQATIRFTPSAYWTEYAGNSNAIPSAAKLDGTLLAQTTGDVFLAADSTFRQYGDAVPVQVYGGLITGGGRLQLGHFGRQMRFTGGFAYDASSYSWQNGSGIWIDTLAVTSTLQTITLASCAGQYSMDTRYCASFLMFGRDASDATADHPLNVATLVGNASSLFDASGKRWRSGGHVLVWGSNTVHVGNLTAGLHVVASRRDQNCDNTLMNGGKYASQGIGFLAVDTLASGTIYGSTNVALTIGSAASGTGFDYTYQSNAVNRLTLDITNGCHAATTLKATDLAMLPARLSGFAGTVTLTETDARSYTIPVDLTVGSTGLCNTVGCTGSGTLAAAPQASAVDITFPTSGPEPVRGKYAVARFSAGGALLDGWTVTLNGAAVSEARIGRHSVALRRDGTGLWLHVDPPGSAIIVR